MFEKPENIANEFIEAWNGRDADRLASLFDEDADFVNVVGLWWYDRSAIRKAHAYGFERIFNASVLELISLKVRHLSEDIAIVHARMRLSGQSPVGAAATPKQRRNIFTFVVRRGDKGWSCVAAHNTDIVPGMETNVIDDNGKFGSANYRDADS